METEPLKIKTSYIDTLLSANRLRFQPCECGTGRSWYGGAVQCQHNLQTMSHCFNESGGNQNDQNVGVKWCEQGCKVWINQKKLNKCERSCWALLVVQTCSNYFEQRFTLWCFTPLPEGKKGMRWIYQDDFLWAHVWSCMHMLSDFVALHCTSSLHCASCFFWSFCLKHQQSTKKHLSNRSIPSLNFRRIDLDTLGPLARPDLCWRGAARYTSYGQLLGAAEPRSQRSTQRPGDLATWPAKRRAAPSEDEPGSTGSTTEKLPKVFFLPVSEIFCLNMFEIDMSITFHDFSILFISPLIWCNDCAATMSPWRMWIHSSWAKLRESFFDP